MDDNKKIDEVTKLKSWRFPLPFQNGLNDQFHRSLTLGYRSRKFRVFGTKPTKEIQIKPSISVTSDAFALLGCSGTGKSTAIENTLKHYPQVIRHTFSDGTVFYQIVYIYVTCPSNSNISTLLCNIAKQIDIALGNTDYMYFNIVDKKRTIGDKASQLVDIIQAFGIGTIIIDEIQFINTSSNTESSYNSLLTLANEGGVRINVVGTEEAYDKIFGTSLKMYRRSGIMINSDNYCTDINFFATICRSLTAYQWFDDIIEFDNEMIAAMYDLTAGVIALLINLYAKMHEEYLQFPASRRPKVNAAFIRKVSEKAFIGLEKHIDKIRNDRYVFKEMKNEKDITVYLETPEDYEQITEKMIQEKTVGLSVRMDNIVSTVAITSITTGLKVSENEIYVWVEKIASLPEYSAATESEIASAVYKMLANEKKGTNKKRKTKKGSMEHIEVCNFLDNEIQEIGERK